MNFKWMSKKTRRHSSDRYTSITKVFWKWFFSLLFSSILFYSSLTNLNPNSSSHPFWILIFSFPLPFFLALWGSSIILSSFNFYFLSFYFFFINFVFLIVFPPNSLPFPLFSSPPFHSVILFPFFFLIYLFTLLSLFVNLCSFFSNKTSIILLFQNTQADFLMNAFLHIQTPS